MNRVTIIVPEALREQAAHVHVLMGKSKVFTTYRNANWQDADGNFYAVSSGMWRDTQIAGAANSAILEREDLQELFNDYDPAGPVDRAFCAAAQAAFTVYDPDKPLTSDPSHILAIIGPDGMDALRMAGVTALETEDV